MKTKTLLIACSLLGSTGAYSASTGSITGQVLDSLKKTPVEGMEVKALVLDPVSEGAPKVYSAPADKEGKFSLKQLPLGKYRLQMMNDGKEITSANAASNLVTLTEKENAIDRQLQITAYEIVSVVLKKEGKEIKGDVYLDGKAFGKTDDRNLIEVGKYDLHAEALDCKSDSIQLNLLPTKNGREITLECKDVTSASVDAHHLE